MLRTCYEKRYFIVESVKREFFSRYTHSLLGATWAVLNPLSMIIVYMLVFSQVMRAKLPGIESGFAYSIYLCAGILPWGLFTEISTRCVNTFIENGNLLKKVAFPKICLPAIVTGSALINFSIISGLFLFFPTVHWPISRDCFTGDNSSSCHSDSLRSKSRDFSWNRECFFFGMLGRVTVFCANSGFGLPLWFTQPALSRNAFKTFWS